MHRTIATFLALIIVVSVLIGCSGDRNVNYEPFNSPVEFRIVETHPNVQDSMPSPVIMLRMETLEDYGIGNVDIQYRILQNAGFIHLYLYGVEIPGIGPDVMWPATAECPISLPTGEYPISFSYDAQDYEAELTIGDDEIHINGIDGGFVVPDTRRYWRFRENSLQYVCAIDPEYAVYAGQFAGQLIEELRFEEFEYGEEGISPFVDRAQWFDHAVERYFIYESADDLTQLACLLSRFIDEMNERQIEANVYFRDWQQRSLIGRTSF